MLTPRSSHKILVVPDERKEETLVGPLEGKIRFAISWQKALNIQ